MKKMICVAVLLFFYTQASYAWWATGHALTAEIASEHLSNDVREAVDKRLSQAPDVPSIVNQAQAFPTPAVLYQTLSYIQGAATWPDDIKFYNWTDQKLKNHYSDLHFLDVDIDLAQKGVSTYCTQTINNPYIEGYVKNTPYNIVKGIQSSIKTLALSTTSDAEKATALRYLIHLMGDLHQPLHISNPTLNNIKTLGGNLVYFGVSGAPSYHQVIGGAPSTDVQSDKFTELHAYFDGLLGEYNQLQETMDSQYSRNGFELWGQYQSHYLSYLKTLATRVGQYPDKVEPGIVNWAVDTSQVGCHILINDSRVSYSVAPNQRSVVVTLNPASFRQYDSVINRQLYLGGIRLAYLLEAIYHPTSGDKTVIAYRNNIINPILTDRHIVALKNLN